MKSTLLAWSWSEPICVHLQLCWNLQLRASRPCIMTGCHNNTGGGPAGEMMALSLLRRDGVLATCNSPSVRSFLPACRLVKWHFLKEVNLQKLYLITSAEPNVWRGEVCLWGGSQGLRGICHLFVLTGPNLFIETAHLFSYPHSKLMKHN